MFKYQQLTAKITKKIVTTAPPTIKYFVKHAPKPLQKNAIEFWINRIFKTAIADGKLEFLRNKCVCIAAKDIELNFYLTLEKNEFRVDYGKFSEDVCFKSTMNDFLLLATNKVDPDTLFFRRRLTISGDTEVALELKNFLDTLDARALIPRPLYTIMNRLAAEVI